MTARALFSRDLAGGGRLFCYQLGGLYLVDVVAWDALPADEPIYHAAYGLLADAEADARCWQTWPV